nr:MAG TPA: hypothetical protein [Caudoviricetes sp.]
MPPLFTIILIESNTQILSNSLPNKVKKFFEQ